MNYVYSSLMSTSPNAHPSSTNRSAHIPHSHASVSSSNTRWPPYNETSCHVQATGNNASQSVPLSGHHELPDPVALPVSVKIQRASVEQPWGFRLQGGCDYRMQLTVKKTTPNSPAAAHLQCGDAIISINGQNSRKLSHDEATALIKNAGTVLDLEIVKHRADVHLTKPSGPVKFSADRAAQLCRI